MPSLLYPEPPETDTKRIDIAHRTRWAGIKRIWAGTCYPKDRNFGIQRITILTAEILLLISPVLLFQSITHVPSRQRRKTRMELYTIAKPVCLFIVLYLGFAANRLAVVIAAVFLAELYLYWVSMLLAGDLFGDVISVRRTMLLLLVNFSEQVLAFGIFYVYSAGIRSDAGTLSAWQDAVYFSVVTAATVGYGDFSPCSENSRLLVSLHIFASLAFIAIFIAYTAGRIEGAEA